MQSLDKLTQRQILIIDAQSTQKHLELTSILLDMWVSSWNVHQLQVCSLRTYVGYKLL